MKFLKSFHLKNKHTKDVEKEVFKAIYSTVFVPVLEAIKENLPVENSYEILRTALLKGKVQYRDGKFYGEWNAKLSREMRNIGATFDYRDNTYKLEHIPMDIQMAIAQSDNLYQNIVSSIGSIDFKLNPIENTVYDSVLPTLKKEFILSLAGVTLLIPRDISVEKYVEEINLSVEKYVGEEIEKLLIYVNQGNNNLTKLYNYLDKKIEMSKRKAEFLSKSVTNQMINEYKSEEYRTLGITQYKWQTMGDDKVRPYHRELNGEIIDYDNPPIQDRYGNRAHAGEYYNCRCRQIPIID